MVGGRCVEGGATVGEGGHGMSETPNGEREGNALG